MNYSYDDLINKKKAFDRLFEIKSPALDPLYLAKNVPWEFIQDYIRKSDEGKKYFKTLEDASIDSSEVVRSFIDYIEYIDEVIWDKQRKYIQEHKRIKKTFCITGISYAASMAIFTMSVPVTGSESYAITDLMNFGESIEFMIKQRQYKKETRKVHEELQNAKIEEDKQLGIIKFVHPKETNVSF